MFSLLPLYDYKAKSVQTNDRTSWKLIKTCAKNDPEIKESIPKNPTDIDLTI